MAKFQIRMLTDADEPVHTATVAVSNADAGRMFDTYRAIYGKVPTVDINEVARDYTDDELWLLFSDGILRGVIANIHNHELEIARAALNPAPINFTVEE